MTTLDAHTGTPDKMPTALKWGVVLLWIQAAATFTAGLLTVSLAQDSGDHEALMGLAVVYMGLGLLLAVCAGFLPGRYSTARITALVIQGVNMTVTVIALAVGGGLPLLPGFVLSVVIVRSLRSNESSAWVNR